MKKLAPLNRVPNGHTKTLDESSATVSLTLDTTEEQFVTGDGRGITLTDQQETDVLALSRPAKRLFLYAFAQTGTLAGACRTLLDEEGRPAVSPKMHEGWLARDDDYRAVYEDISASVDARWDEIYQRLALEGLQTAVYDGNGNLKERTVRQDAGILQKVVASRLSKYRQSESGGTAIQINIQRTQE